MDTFMQKHASLIKGTISCPDRIIIKGYLPFAYPASAESFLNNNDIMFIDFKKFAKQKSEELVAAAQKYAASRYRITAKGKCIMSAAIDMHENFIPAAFKNAA